MTSSRALQPFGPAFWWAYAANTLLMVAVSLMFRYSDFVTSLGGSEYELGWIVGIGMVGGVAMRGLQGMAIDRYGSGNIWLISVLVVIASLLAHLGIHRLDSFAVYAWRIVYACSLAGAFGASIVFVSLRAPAERLGETIGSLGSSGFVGMAIGPWIADWLFHWSGPGREGVEGMFLWSAAASAASLVATAAARCMGGPHRNTSHRHQPIGWLLRRYHPGPILLLGIAMGLGINIPFFFVRPFAETLGISGIRTFFVTYSLVAFLARIGGRRLPDQWGVRRTVLIGMSFLAVHLLAFIGVRTERGLILPAILGGLAHAFIFPATMAAASNAFPLRHRGLATAWMLTMMDLGNLVGQPAAGSLLQLARRAHWPAYPTMFAAMSAGLLLVTAWYAWRTTMLSAECPRAGRNAASSKLTLPNIATAPRETVIASVIPARNARCSHEDTSTWPSGSA